MKDQPLISIIIPVYNAEKYLPQCLDSIIHQTYSNLEIICINDASTDGSLKILNQFAQGDRRVYVVDKPNEGVSRARNSGLQMATGQYVMFVDADDWIDADTCEKSLAAMDNNQADIVMWSYVSEYGTSRSPKTIFPENCVFDRREVLNKLHRRLIGIVAEELEHPELADSISPVWGKLYKRSLIEQSGATFIDLAEIGTYEDGMFNLETFFYANKVVYLKQCLYHYRRNNTASVTSGYREELFDLWQNLYQRMAQYIQEKKLPPIYEEALHNRIALSLLGLGLNITESDYSIGKKMTLLKEILNDGRYRAAYKQMNFSYFPIHWKVFYGFAKHRCAFGVCVLLYTIKRIIN